MTLPELALLKTSIDKVVGLTFADGERTVKVLFVYDEEGDAPDVFFIEVDRAPDGRWIEKKGGGYSELLEDIVRVRQVV